MGVLTIVCIALVLIDKMVESIEEEGNRWLNHDIYLVQFAELKRGCISMSDGKQNYRETDTLLRFNGDKDNSVKTKLCRVALRPVKSWRSTNQDKDCWYSIFACIQDGKQKWLLKRQSIHQDTIKSSVSETIIPHANGMNILKSQNESKVTTFRQEGFSGSNIMAGFFNNTLTMGQSSKRIFDILTESLATEADDSPLVNTPEYDPEDDLTTRYRCKGTTTGRTNGFMLRQIDSELECIYCNTMRCDVLFVTSTDREVPCHGDCLEAEVEMNPDVGIALVIHETVFGGIPEGRLPAGVNVLETPLSNSSVPEDDKCCFCDKKKCTADGYVKGKLTSFHRLCALKQLTLTPWDAELESLIGDTVLIPSGRVPQSMVPHKAVCFMCGVSGADRVATDFVNGQPRFLHIKCLEDEINKDGMTEDDLLDLATELMKDRQIEECWYCGNKEGKLIWSEEYCVWVHKECVIRDVMEDSADAINLNIAAELLTQEELNIPQIIQETGKCKELNGCVKMAHIFLRRVNDMLEGEENVFEPAPNWITKLEEALDNE